MSDFKYSFRELIGNQLNISILKRSINNGTFRQFTIFDGILGTGKSTCARIAAMALTCDNPYNGEPCCACASCKANMDAFEHASDSSYVSTVNAGKLSSKDDVVDLVHRIFDLQGSVKNKVFLIEEAHALAKVQGAETMLLSELDNIAPNIYLIFSTTRAFDLKAELLSRAEKFTFGRLSDIESRQLLVTTAEQKGYSVPDEILNLLVKYGRGIPRNLLKSLDFTIDESLDLSELRAHLQVIDDSQLIQLFESMQSPQIQLYLDSLTEIKTSVNSQEIMQSLKEFLVQVAFVIEGDIHGTFGKSEINSIKQIFTRQKYYKMINLIDKLPRKIDDADLDMLLLQLRMIIQSRNTASVISESHKVGAVERDATAERQASLAKASTTASAKKISLDAIKKLQGD